MKYYIEIKTDAPLWEKIEVSHRHPGDEKAAPYWRLWRKALRMVVAMKKSGVRAELRAVPESAADIMRLARKGGYAARMMAHFEKVAATPARARAMKAWRRAAGNGSR